MTLRAREKRSSSSSNSIPPMPRGSPPIRRLQAGPAPQEEHQLDLDLFRYAATARCTRRASISACATTVATIVQTVKTAKSKTELIERLEWEREIASRKPDLDGVSRHAAQAAADRSGPRGVAADVRDADPPPCLPHLAGRLRDRGRHRSRRDRHPDRHAGHLRIGARAQARGRPRSCFGLPACLARRCRSGSR